MTLWASEGIVAAPPHPRAAGLVAMLRRTPEGARAAALADEGDASALRTLVRPEQLEPLGPRLLHHLALYHERLARLRGDAADWQLALAAWLALDRSPGYLRELAGAVADDALDTSAKQAWVRGACWQAWNRLRRLGEQGAAERTLEARMALRVFADPSALARRAGIPPDAWPAIEARAASSREAILDAALAPLAAHLDEADGREPDGEHVDLLETVVHLWRWAGHPPQVERFFVDRALSIGWSLYKGKRFDALRRMNETARPLLDAFGERIRQEPREISYASRVAQFLVFRAEMEPRFERQLDAAERAVALCETHRNGRLVLADLLAERALRTLERAPLLGRRRHVERARADVTRARSLWSDSLPRLEQAREALARERQS